LSAKDEGFLSRWSRRKTEARAGGAPEPDPAAGRVPAGGPPPQGAAGAPPGGAAQAAAPELPAIESLSPHSEISAFLRPDVDPALRGRALKTLFSDPALYPMDGLDVYIDDYSKPDPLPEGWLAKLNQFATLHGEPPAQEAPPQAPVQAGAAPSQEAAESPQQPASEDPSDTSAAASVARDSGNPEAT
jgi:hypothetical protein